MKLISWGSGALLLLLIIALWSCTPPPLDSAEELQQYVADQDNGLCKEKNIGVLQVRLSHRPTDLLVEQELGHQQATMTLVDSLREQYDNYLYFLLSFSANGREIENWQTQSNQQFSQRVQALAFGMAEQVKLSSDTRDSIPLVDFVYQRTFGGGAASSVLFAFERTPLKHADWLSFQLKDIGLGIGTTRFRFDGATLRSAPTIQFIR